MQNADWLEISCTAFILLCDSRELRPCLVDECEQQLMNESRRKAVVLHSKDHSVIEIHQQQNEENIVFNWQALFRLLSSTKCTTGFTCEYH